VIGLLSDLNRMDADSYLALYTYNYMGSVDTSRQAAKQLSELSLANVLEALKVALLPSLPG
jgi:hypothetical protein